MYNRTFSDCDVYALCLLPDAPARLTTPNSVVLLYVYVCMLPSLLGLQLTTDKNYVCMRVLLSSAPTSWSRMVTVGHALCVFFFEVYEKSNVTG